MGKHTSSMRILRCEKKSDFHWTGEQANNERVWDTTSTKPLSGKGTTVEYSSNHGIFGAEPRWRNRVGGTSTLHLSSTHHRGFLCYLWPVKWVFNSARQSRRQESSSFALCTSTKLLLMPLANRTSLERCKIEPMVQELRICHSHIKENSFSYVWLVERVLNGAEQSRR